jgi:uncharacterized protein YigE (DUF2233 family)
MMRVATLLLWTMATLFVTGSAGKQEQGSLYKTVVRPACAAARFEGQPFTVCRVDPARHEMRIVLSGKNGKPLRNFAALAQNLGPEARRVAFAMNAGMYDARGFPIGLYIEHGTERTKLNRADGPGNFHMKPNGVFWVDGTGAHIAPTDRFARQPREGMIWATQSGPMLVIGGKLHPQIAPDGASLYVRNAVGVTIAGKAFFVISDSRVSFGKIARMMRDQLGCPNALYLDGYVSSLWDGASGRNNQDSMIGPMVVILERPR